MLVKTDLSIAIPEGYYGRIAPRSSLAWKNHIDVGAGVIDEDYRGPLGVVLFNHGDTEFEGMITVLRRFIFGSKEGRQSGAINFD